MDLCLEPVYRNILIYMCRDDSKPTMASLERTRSGWVKAQAEGTSLRNLHIPTTPHMGLSIPAVAYPLREDGTADTDIKPQPVTLFFGIIDFLQVEEYFVSYSGHSVGLGFP